MAYEVRLETLARPCPVAVVRRRASLKELPHVIPQACGLVWDVIRAQRIPGAGRNVALYLDDEINIEVGLELETPVAGHGEVVGSALPAGTVATTVHFGPYAKLPEAHRAIRSWCAQRGHSPAGLNWEVYDRWTDECERDPSRIRTDVFYLLKEAGASVRH